MADERTKISELSTATPADADLVPIVDVSDTSGGAQGTSKKSTLGALWSLISGLLPSQFANAPNRAILARAASSSGSPAWLQGTTNSTVLRSVSNELSFGEVTHEMIENGLAWSFLGRSANSIGPVANIQVTSGQIVGNDGSTFGGKAPNAFVFKDSADGNISLQVAPTAFAKNATLAAAAALTLDYTPPPSSLTRITYLVTFGDAGVANGLKALDRVLVVRRIGTAAPTVTLDKPIFEAADYSPAPAVLVADSISGVNVRMSVTNQEGSARFAKIAVSSVEDLL